MFIFVIASIGLPIHKNISHSRKNKFSIEQIDKREIAEILECIISIIYYIIYIVSFPKKMHEII